MPEEENNYPHRKNLNYSDNYRKRYAEKFGKKEDKKEENPVEPLKSKENKPEETILREVEETLELKRGPRWEKILIVAIYAIVLLAIIYFVMASFFPNYLPFSDNIYTINAWDGGIFDSLKSFYIDGNVLGDKVDLNGTIVRPIISAAPFNLVFVPKTNIQNKNATLTLNLMLNGTGSNIYLNNQLIFPSLENYQLIEENDKDYIYVNNNTLQYINTNNLNKSGSSEEFIYQNMPGASVWSTRVLQPVDVKLNDYKQEVTLINTTFRDNLNLAVYAENNLKISFTKQDLNMYIGQDEYTISITDQAGNIIFSQIYEDDKDKLASNKLGPEQNFDINLDNLTNGIYYVSFVKDVFNQYSDSTLKDIEVDSNKILILGTFLPTKPFKYYSYSNKNVTISFQHFADKLSRKIILSGCEETNITLNKKTPNVNEYFIINSGNCQFNLIEGNLWVFQTIVSPSRLNWFDVSLNYQEEFTNQDLLVIGKDKYNHNSGELRFYQYVVLTDKTTKSGLRILDANEVYFEGTKLEVN